LDQHILNLLKKYRDNTATEVEKEALMKWYREVSYQDGEFPGDEGLIEKVMLDRLMGEIKPERKPVSIRRWSVAASIVILLGLSLLFILKPAHKPVKQAIATNKNDVTPGGEKAFLTLANGSKISLTDTRNGKVATQAGLQINKEANGKLIYTIKSSGPAKTTAQQADLAYNTISTPIGGQYQVILPDGSKVWLNALSSIKFPVNFSTLNERRIELSGEAYFEVEHDINHPFKVVTEKQEVEDIGTVFDINAYPDENNTKTTLIKGSVRVFAGGGASVLKPGQQSKFSDKITVSEVNTQAVVAWKNGYFMFDDEKLEDIMRLISRWYNIQVIYTDDSVKQETFGAVSTRFANISVLLNMMEQTGNAHFKIKGATVTISKK
jgi:transmembrane sensor